MRRLLTIAIPTYERAEYLRRLLGVLHKELVGLEDRVAVVVADNASTDHTLDVIVSFSYIWPELYFFRNDANVGSDENFCKCIEKIETKYFLIMGDDDLPRGGLFLNLMDLLKTENPDLVYLESLWTSCKFDVPVISPIDKLRYEMLSREKFARRTNIWLTFISGMVINRDAFYSHCDGGLGLRRYSGTNLVQLGWTLGVLKMGNRFFYVSDFGILATSENTGGYGLLSVFGVAFNRIVAGEFGPGSKISDAVICRNIIGYLPSLIWRYRFSGIGGFVLDSSQIRSLKVEMCDRFLFKAIFWVILFPILRFPKPMALPFAICSNLLNRLIRFFDRHV